MTLKCCKVMCILLYSLVSLCSADAFLPGAGFRRASAAGAGLRGETGGGRPAGMLLDGRGVLQEDDEALSPRRSSAVRTTNTP